MSANPNRLSRMVVLGLLGGVGGGTLSFLFQLIKQIPCHEIVIRGPSCPAFTLSVRALAVGAVVGMVSAIYIHRIFCREGDS